MELNGGLCDGGKIYFKTCKILLTSPYNKVELVPLGMLSIWIALQD